MTEKQTETEETTASGPETLDPLEDEAIVNDTKNVIARVSRSCEPEERQEATKQSNSDTQESQPRERLTELETALSEAKKSLDARTVDCDRLKAALDDAVSAYRKLAVSTNALYSDDMISGSTVEEIDASIKKVNGLVKKMRSSLEAELKDLTVPAGAPERSAPDLSGLSPRDKIKYGIQEKK